MRKKDKKNKLDKLNTRKKKLFLKSVERLDKFQEFNGVEIKIQQAKIKNDNIVLERIKESLFQDFKLFIIPDSGDLLILIPEIFCLCENYNGTLITIKKFASSIYDYLGREITLDFSKCLKVDTAALFLLQIIRLELKEKLERLENKLKHVKIVPDIKAIGSKQKDVLRLMLVCGFPVSKSEIENMEDNTTLTPMDNAGYFKGSASQKHYLENKKSVFSTKVVLYFDTCLQRHGYKLTDTERGNIDGIIGEMLSNAEDHSGSNDWYITANFSKELSKDGNSDVGEMNFTILNFGKSIFEAFEETKAINSENYKLVKKYAMNIMNNFETNFNIDQLYLLGTMQDQISRLKFERESRGTGTMKFINSFLDLGDYVNKSKNFIPNLSIFSGNVHLICDNEFKPYVIDTVNCLSLNPQKDLSLPPSSSHLKKLNQKFPGTLLSVKIYINKEHFDKKYGSNNYERV